MQRRRSLKGKIGTSMVIEKAPNGKKKRPKKRKRYFSMSQQKDGSLVLHKASRGILGSSDEPILRRRVKPSVGS